MRLSSFVSLVAAASTVSATLRGLPCSRKPTVRKEWRDTTSQEKKAFIDAIKCLGNTPHGSNIMPTGDTPNIPPLNTSASRYDDFVYAHMDSNVKDHFTALFLPWHRWFLHTFERELKTKCNYNGTLIFWDWSRDTASIPNSPIFNSNPTHGLGSLGTAANMYAVTDGAFGSTSRAYPSPHIIQRNFTLYPFRPDRFPFPFQPTDPNMPATAAFTSQAVAKVVGGSKGNYSNFAYMMDGVRAQGMHNAAHLMMGGDMADPLWSPNDPIFYMHHAHLDCIWDRWQKKSPRNAQAYGGGLTQDLQNYDAYPVGAPPKAYINSDLPTVGLSAPVKVGDVMFAQNEYLCYRCAY